MPCANPIRVATCRNIEKSSSGKVYRPAGGHVIFVGCGKCDYCKQKKLDGIVERLRHEYDATYQTLFITWTYDNEHVHRDLAKSDAKEMLSNLKNILNRHYGKWQKKPKKLLESFKYKYFCVGEYGDTRGRVHIHCLLFLPRSVDWHYIQQANKFGYICDIQVAGRGSLFYCAVYCVKALVSEDNEQYKGKAPPFYLQSNGIGLAVLDTRLASALRREKSYVYRDAMGFKHVLPRYTRQHMFDYFERQDIADEISKEVESRRKHFPEDKNLLIDNLQKKYSNKVSKLQKSYKKSLL